MRIGNQSDDLSNVEDRRGFTGGGMKLGLGGILILGALSLIFRQNLFTAVEQSGGQPQTGPAVEQRKASESGLEKVAVGTFNDTQAMWRQRIRGYQDAKLVLFWEQVDSGCGGASAAMGPFYCPPDQRVYIDLGFYQELSKRFGAPGDFAQAYVIAHEMGHHVQKMLGISDRVTRQEQSNPSGRNALSVKLELQADCLAGVWGNGAAKKGMLDPGDAEEGLRAAASVGDDRLQKMAGKRVAPESFTHGSAADRSRWFKRGFDSGSVDSCDTFQE